MRLVAVLAVLFAALQLVPVDRSNPPVEERLETPPEVRRILERACYDCHSNETRWPWYSFVAPVSWLLAHDVHEGREHLNFSTWNRYDEDEQLDLIEDCWELVDEGEMPLWYYLPLHPEARLSPDDRAALRAWVLDGAGED